MLKENLAFVENEIQAACVRANRSRKEVTLVAVSKTKPVSELRKAYDLGVRVFGECHGWEVGLEKLPHLGMNHFLTHFLQVEMQGPKGHFNTSA